MRRNLGSRNWLAICLPAAGGSLRISAMSAITILGAPRQACSGPTRRETLKAGALSLLGGLFKDKPVHIRDICATIYHLLGIDPEMLIHDRANRPIAVAQGGQAIADIVG
jgi:hypothetical protein